MGIIKINKLISGKMDVIMSSNPSEGDEPEQERGIPLHFIALENGTQIKMGKYSDDVPAVNLQYSLDDKTWNDYVMGDTITLGSVGDTVYFKAKGSNKTMSGPADYKYNNFVIPTGSVKVDGDVNSLLEERKFVGLDLSKYDKYTFASLFKGCENIIECGDIFSSQTLKDHCYYKMFYNCKGMTLAPALPATTLENDCYNSMFYSCEALKQAQEELPATTLAESCYQSMFTYCQGMTTPPILPATEMKSWCYYQMFSNCTHIQVAPELPSTTLADRCYESMFNGCSRMVRPPELPATELKDHCYSAMFSGCEALVEAPELPATELVLDCYYNMFLDCSKLNTVTSQFTSFKSGLGTSGWLYGVSSSGTLYAPQALIDEVGDSRSVNAVPTGWNIAIKSDSDEPEVKEVPLHLVSLSGSPTISIEQDEGAEQVKLQYSRDNENWTPYTFGTEINIPNVGDKVYFKAIGENFTLANNEAATWFDVKNPTEGTLRVDGDVNSLLKESDFVGLDLSMYGSCTFAWLFCQIPGIVECGDIFSSQTLQKYCYYMMFYQCSDLSVGPSVMPGLEIPDYGYYAMFQETKLSTSPHIKATTVKLNGCYQLFGLCTNLSDVTVSFTLFNGCTSWLYNVASTGTFHCPEVLIGHVNNSYGRSANTVPRGWTMVAL